MNLDLAAAYSLHRGESSNRSARQVDCREKARDIVPDGFLILARTAAVAAVEHPSGLPFHIATNLAVVHLRHPKIAESHAELAVGAEDAAHPPAEAEVSMGQWRAMLHRAIVELPPRCRDAFILHKIQGLSYREVAETLGISQSAVERHIIKALMHCRTRLGPHLRKMPGPH